MVQTLAPREAQALVAAGGVDVIDVREPYELASGYVPGSRNVPLGDLKTDPVAALRPGKVLFVCARGVRSENASVVAEKAGAKEVFHLDGGLEAWLAAGLAVELPAPKPAAAPSTAPPAAPPDADASCGLPEPGLDLVVGANLKALRAARGLSLDELARSTGLSRGLLGQIELGKMQPSVSVVWRIAQAFGVHFSALLASGEQTETSLLRAADAKRLVSPDGRFSSRALYPFAEKPDVEFYELFLAGHSREDAQAHAPGTRENLIVTAGQLDLVVGGKEHSLAKGDAIVFTADVPHSYVNPASADCWMYLVMTYARV